MEAFEDIFDAVDLKVYEELGDSEVEENIESALSFVDSLTVNDTDELIQAIDDGLYENIIKDSL